MELIRSLGCKLAERFGKREGRELAQQAVERLAVAAVRGVGAQLAGLVAASPGEDDLCSNHARPITPADDGDVTAGSAGYKHWGVWAKRNTGLTLHAPPMFLIPRAHVDADPSP